MKTVTSREKVASFRRVIHFFFPSIYYNQDDDLKEEMENFDLGGITNENNKS